MKATGRQSLWEQMHDPTGQSTAEYVLLLAAFGLPLMYVFAVLLALMSEFYGMVTFLETLPLP